MSAATLEPTDDAFVFMHKASASNRGKARQKRSFATIKLLFTPPLFLSTYLSCNWVNKRFLCQNPFQIEIGKAQKVNENSLTLHFPPHHLLYLKLDDFLLLSLEFQAIMMIVSQLKMKDFWNALNSWLPFQTLHW